jgi:hyperosmotically inducible periplasmic protein
MKYLLFGLLGVLAAGCSQSSPSASGDRTASRPNATADPVDRTNTGINVRDRDSAMQTPGDQSENQADITTTADIRKRVEGEKMSVTAHNVKIITRDGKVTLRGPVATPEEKHRIEEIARNIAGANSVESQLEVNTK